MYYSIWLCSKRIISFSTSQIFHFWNKVKYVKKGQFFFSLYTTLPYNFLATVNLEEIRKCEIVETIQISFPFPRLNLPFHGNQRSRRRRKFSGLHSVHLNKENRGTLVVSDQFNPQTASYRQYKHLGQRTGTFRGSLKWNSNY